MAAHVDLAASLLRARARREVTRAIAALTVDDARAVLLDVYAELEIDDAQPDDGPAQAEPEAEEPQRKGPPEGSFSDRLLRTLAANPRMAIGDLAVAIYGISDASTRGKTRSLLSALKGRGDVDNVSEGAWEVVNKEAMKTKS